MPGISIITNFDVNTPYPIDSRLVATNSTARINTPYLYAGLKVYQTDIKRTFTYNGLSWDVEGSGIYGGSGSIPGDTFINFGTVSTSIGSESNDLVFQSDLNSPFKSYVYNNFIRHSTSGVADFQNVEFRQQFKYFSGSALINSAYIGFNSVSNGFRPGTITFGAGFGPNLSEKMRLSWDGKLGIATNDPKEYLQIGTSSSTSSPLVIHNSGSAIIGYNWWFGSGVDQFFDSTKPSTKIIQSNGSFLVQNRIAGAASGDYTTTIFSVGTNGGRVGIRTNTPSVALDVNGSINSNSLINGQVVTAGTVSSSNRVEARRVDFTGLANTYIVTERTTSNGPIDSLSLRVGNSQCFRSTGTHNQMMTDTSVLGDLSVYSGDLEVIDGSITNYEASSTLVPDSTVYYDINSGSATWTSNLPISSFTYSFNFYRVGASTQVDFVVKYIGTAFSASNFKGLLFKFSSARFVPVSYGFGSGFASYPAASPSISVPVSVEAFKNDTDVLFSGASPIVPSTSGNDFWIRIRTHKLSTSFGSELLTGSYFLNNTYFKGSIVFKSGAISTFAPPAPPIIISLPQSGA